MGPLRLEQLARKFLLELYRELAVLKDHTRLLLVDSPLIGVVRDFAKFVTVLMLIIPIVISR